MNTITKKKLDSYFRITGEAIQKIRAAEFDESKKDYAFEFLDMAERYYSDAGHFSKKGNYVDAFAALNYAHGWLDAGVRIGLFKVSDSRLFAAD